MATATQAESSSTGYLPVATDALAPTETLDFDLYIRPSPKDPVVMFRERSYPLGTDDLDRLHSGGIDTLYIKVGAHESYCKYLRTEVLNNDAVPALRRFEVLSAVNRAVFEKTFKSGNTDRMVDFANVLGKQMTDLVCDEGLMLRNLMPLMAHDYYTYTHVANVCTYTIILANGMGIFSREQMLELAMGALLHDIGKRHIPPDVLNCPGRLNDEQWEYIRRHPLDGFRELCERDDLHWGQLMMVYQHHERPDGKGYPVGVADDQIHEWARICKVADVFDALTSDRPYRKADSVENVLDFFDARVDTEFDKELVQCFRATLK